MNKVDIRSGAEFTKPSFGMNYKPSLLKNLTRYSRLFGLALFYLATRKYP